MVAIVVRLEGGNAVTLARPLKSLLLSALFLLAACTSVPMRHTSPASAFAQVQNGVRLHYLDFGGRGEPVILLAGPGNTAWIYHDFGLDLARDFRVLAVTRRGHGESDMPDTGYDQATLVEDLRAFLDSRGFRRVHLVGSSTAGEELTRFASRYPDRVGSLVYLDAAYDRSVDVERGTPDRPPRPTAADRASVDAYVAYLVRTRGVAEAPPGVLERNWRASVSVQPGGTAGMRWGEAQFREYMQSLAAGPPDYSRVRAPALAIYAVGVPQARLERATPELRAAIERHRETVVLPWRAASIEQFRNGMQRGEVVELDSLHHPFLHRPSETASLVRAFLNRHPLPR
jgi:pimeloyl-ACP methyl ester carboxylesterase